jgi:hypothetical protein
MEKLQFIKDKSIGIELKHIVTSKETGGIYSFHLVRIAPGVISVMPANVYITPHKNTKTFRMAIRKHKATKKGKQCSMSLS